MPNSSTTRFPLGQIVATPGVVSNVPPFRCLECIALHAFGDWGNVWPGDADRNDQALIDGTRLHSAYAIDPSKPCKGYGENCLWIITEADRSVTTLLLPDEY